MYKEQQVVCFEEKQITEPKNKRKKPKKQKKQLEFMQKIVSTTILLPFMWVTFSYILAWFDKSNPLENLSSVVVSVPIAAIIGYVSQNCFRAMWFQDKTIESVITESRTTKNKITENNGGGRSERGT